MRDFIEADIDATGTYLGQDETNRIGVEDMTEQGFKRFQRKSKSRTRTAEVSSEELTSNATREPVFVLGEDHAAVKPDLNASDDELLDDTTEEHLDEPQYERDDLGLPPFVDAVEGDESEEAYAAEDFDDQDLDASYDEVPLLEPEPRIQLPAPQPETWEMLRQVPLGVRRHILKKSSLISFFREDPAAQRFDLLRTRLLKALKERGWHRVAIASPTKGCGATFTAVNLALSLSRVPDTRTILMDLNHRDPGVAKTLDISGLGDMPGFLAGRVPLERHIVKCGENLAVGATSYSDLDASEILQDSVSRETLELMYEQLNPDVVLFDLPPVLEYDDVAAFLPQVDGLLLVADGVQTTAEDLAACERLLDNQAQLMGVVLNRGR